MTFKHLFKLLSFCCFFVSCVPTKELIYLQKKDNNSPVSVAPITTTTYRMQVSDILNISISAIDEKAVSIFNVKKQSELINEQSLYFTGYSIDNHGDIRIPILGQVAVLGLTADEIRSKIELALLKDHFKKEAGIFVNVKLSGFRYTINGEITVPGTKTLSLEKVSILDAIANAGDITITGNRKEVMIIRQFPQGVETFTIDLTDYKALQSPYFYLQPNDYIYIKPIKQKSWGTGKTGIESLSSILTILSLVTTTILLLRQ